MIKTNICKYCGKPFEWDWHEGTRGRGPGFCCEDHRRMQINMRSNERQKNAKLGKGVISQKVCLHCGKQYDYSYGSNQYYCSDKCAGLARQPHICKQCGKEFPHKHNSLNKFCERACFLEYQRTHPEISANKNRPRSLSKSPLRMIYQCICEICGKPFETTSETKTYCSYKCQLKIQTRKQHKKNKAIYVPRKIKCKECGKEYVTKFGDTHRSFCSQECMTAWCRRQGRNNHRKRLRGALVDTNITLKDLCKRDNSVCYLCGRQIDWNDYFVDDNGAFIVGPNYPSIDHVHPLSKGGLHAWDNVRLAHCHCNTLKRDTILNDIHPSLFENF